MVARKHTQTFCSDLTNFKQNSTLLEAKYGKSEVLSHPTACTPPAVALPKWGGTFGRQIKAARLFGGLSGPYRKAWWGIHPPPPGRPPTHGVAGIPQSPGGLYLGFHIGGGAT